MIFTSEDSLKNAHVIWSNYQPITEEKDRNENMQDRWQVNRFWVNAGHVYMRLNQITGQESTFELMRIVMADAGTSPINK